MDINLKNNISDDSYLHDAIQTSYEVLNKIISKDDPQYKYLETFNQMYLFFDKVYQSNHALLECAQSMNQIILTNSESIKDMINYSQNKINYQSMKSDYLKAKLQYQNITLTLQAKSHQIESLKSKAYALAGQTSKIPKCSYNSLNSIQHDIDVGKGDLVFLKDQLQNNQNEIISYNQSIDLFKNELQDNNESDKFYIEQYELLKNEILTKENEKSLIEKELKEMSNHSISLKKDIEEQENKISKKKKQLMILPLESEDILKETMKSQLSCQRNHIPYTKIVQEQENLQSKIELSKKRYDEKIHQYEILSKEINDLSITIEQNLSTFKDLTFKWNEIKKEKEELCIKERNFQDQILELRFKLYSMHENLESERKNVQKLKNFEKQELNELINAENDSNLISQIVDQVNQNTLNEKTNIQIFKKKVHQLNSEIDNNTLQRNNQMKNYFQEKANIEFLGTILLNTNAELKKCNESILTQDQNNTLEEQTKIHLIRDCQIENEKNKQLEENCNIIGYKIRDFGRMIDNINDKTKSIHKAKVMLNEAIKELESMEKMVLISFKESQSKNEILIQQINALKRLLERANETKLKQQSSNIEIRNSIINLKNSLREKENLTEKLQENIKTLTATLKRGSTQYSSITSKIQILKKQFQEMLNKNEQLSKLSSKLFDLKKQENSLSALKVYNQAQANALEFMASSPFRVHRWTFEGAVDSQRMYLLKYKDHLISKLKSAEAQLKKITDEKLHLEKQLSELENKCFTSETYDSYALKMAAYKSDIAQKVQELAEMQQILTGDGNPNSINPQINLQMSKCAEVRNKLYKRIAEAQTIKSMNIHSNMPSTLFITQNEIIPPVSCGFNVHPPIIPPLKLGDLSNNSALQIRTPRSKPIKSIISPKFRSYNSSRVKPFLI